MTRPREVVPGRYLFITRRCTQRMFLLRPGENTNQGVEYCLGDAAARTGVEVLFFAACSNHIHYGLYDPEGRYPEFIEHFHKMLAKVMNCHWGRWENFWASEQTSVVHLPDADAVFDEMIYTLTNPVKC